MNTLSPASLVQMCVPGEDRSGGVLSTLSIGPEPGARRCAKIAGRV